MINSNISSVLIGFAATIAAGMLIVPTVAQGETRAATPVEILTSTYARANGALMRGDAATWHKLVPLSEDGVLFSPFGGTPSHFADYTPERIERMGRFFKNGSFRQEVVQSLVTDDMIVLATIERANVEVGGLEAQDWALRVTSVFRRDGSHWVLAHRHADPIVDEVSLAQAAELARGQRAPAG
jgi:ketosteroid isomerase-like protein